MKKIYIKLAGVAAVLACVASGPVQAQAGAYPTKPVRLVVGYAPGGTTDISARMIADVLGKEFGQTFVVENKPGANSNIGAESVARSPADGYTLFVGSISTAINRSLYSKMSYDALKDLDAVALLNVVPNILAVNASVPVKTVQEYVDYAKKNPGKLTCASPGNGSSAHLGCELFKMKTGIDILHVPYRGSGPAVADLLGGQVDYMFDSITSAKPHIASGKLRALGVTTTKRSAALPDVPTMQEAGVPGYELMPWFAAFAPAGTPPEAVAKLNEAMRSALADPKVKATLDSIGAEPIGSTPDALRDHLAKETAQWKDLVKERGIKIN